MMWDWCYRKWKLDSVQNGRTLLTAATLTRAIVPMKILANKGWCTREPLGVNQWTDPNSPNSPSMELRR
jgi:hypothetical protein